MEIILFVFEVALMIIVSLVIATVINWQILLLIIMLKNPHHDFLAADERADLFNREKLLNSDSSLERFFARIDKVLSSYCAKVFLPLISSLPKLISVFVVILIIWLLSNI